MTRVNILLLLAVLASAFYLVRTQYESRRLTTDFDRARSEALKLDVEHDQLDAERRSQAAPLRVEKIAREQLNMRTITPAITQYLGPAKGAGNGADNGSGNGAGKAADAGAAKAGGASSDAATAQERRP
jgi:cell division protein FtsL